MVVVDDRATSDSLAAVLERDGFRTIVANDPSEAFGIQEQQHPAAMIVGNELARDANGLELARRLKERDPDAAVLLLTGSAALDGVVAGAAELDGLLVKPLLPQVFVQSVRNALLVRNLAVENRTLSNDLSQLALRQREEVVEPTTRAEPPDPSGFAERLDAALVQSQRDGSSLILVVVELGGWRSVNDELGQAAAEEAVKLVSLRLSAARRKSDVVGRIADDRFAVACSDIKSLIDARRVVRIILDEVEVPAVGEGTEHWLVPVAGAVVSDPAAPGQSSDALLDEAEVALICARDEGRSWRIFEKSMRDQAFARANVGQAIREAMDNNELLLAYERVTELQTSRVVGTTARLLWHRPSETVVLSSEFLAQEGDLSLSAQVDAWMLDRAFADLASWREAHWIEDTFHLALSVSAREVADPQFTETIEELLEKHGIPPSMLRFDLSGDAARQAVAADSALLGLHELGVTFGFDDFGGAEMSLSWLLDLPVSSLKIDPLLIESLDARDDPHGTALVRSLIALGHELHLTLVGKAVNTPAQKMALLAMGCEFAQDSGLGRPGPPDTPWASVDESLREPPGIPVEAEAQANGLGNPQS
jgi:diguanylate cyclase (GGDEF)-like protein